MALKVERRDGSQERAVLTGMIVSRAVLSAVSQRWQRGLFASRFSNIIGGWAIEYYNKYKRAPMRNIEHYFDEWAQTADKETIRAVEQYLVGLSDEYERLKKTTSPDAIIDVAAKLFRRVAVSEMREQLEADLESNDIDKAEARIAGYRKIELGLGSGVELLTDEAATQAAFETRGTSLIDYPDALGNFFSSALGRDAFVAFMGKAKIGKSYILLDMAVRAAEQGRRVAYFEVGDNSQHQVIRRVACRIAQRPLDAGAYEFPTAIETPDGGDSLPVVERERRKAPALTPDAAMAAFSKLAGRVGGDVFKLSCHPNSSISVAGIETILEGWGRDGWVPDVIVIDYSDILAPIDRRADVRESINTSWKAMRALSQRLHCLVVTATQTDADSYKTSILRRDNFADDRRKYDHVTGMVGINQTTKEKAEGIYRLNFVVLRELEFSEEKCVWAAGCLAAACPLVVSTF